ARLYLTISHRLLGGEHFHSMIEGAPLGTTGGLALRNMYYDRGASDGFGQWFAQFDPAYR
nr:riboflavin biosynthesis protein RibD [Gammaproteobacteria bacterium]